MFFGLFAGRPGLLVSCRANDNVLFASNFEDSFFSQSPPPHHITPKWFQVLGKTHLKNSIHYLNYSSPWKETHKYSIHYLNYYKLEQKICERTSSVPANTQQICLSTHYTCLKRMCRSNSRHSHCVKTLSSMTMPPKQAFLSCN